MAGQRPGRRGLFAEQWEQAIAWFLPGGELERITLRGVRRSEVFGGVIYTLPVNPGLHRMSVAELREQRMMREQEGGGVPFDSDDRGNPPADIAIAQRAIVQRVLAEFGNAETFREFIARMTPSPKRAGEFYDRLMAVEVPEEYQSKRELKNPRAALKRAIERAGTAKRVGRKQFHLNLTKPEYIWRLQVVRRQTDVLAGALHNRAVSIGVTGDWEISEDKFPFTRHDTDHSRPPSPAHTVLMQDGRRFCVAVENDYDDYVNEGEIRPERGVLLTRVYGLHVEVSNSPRKAERYARGRVRGEASKRSGKRRTQQRRG